MKDITKPIGQWILFQLLIPASDDIGKALVLHPDHHLEQENLQKNFPRMTQITLRKYVEVMVGTNSVPV